jgi:hypothetical protein
VLHFFLVMAFRQEQWASLLIQNPAGIGARVELSENCVLGKAVEISLRLTFRPAVGQLPVPLTYQRAEDLRRFALGDVLMKGELVPATVEIEVPALVAAKAIEITRDVVAKMSALSCSICSVDHTAASSSSVAHDILMLAAAKSSFGEGLQSAEIKLREIVFHPSRYDWFGVLTREAEPLLIAELATEMGRRLLKGRVLVLVQLASGCAVSGAHKIHVAHCASAQFPLAEEQPATWRKIDGWERFDWQQQHVTPTMPALPVAPPAAQPAAPPAASQPQLSPDAKWDVLVVRMSAQGAWLPLQDFLKQVGESALHPKRFLERTGEESDQIWQVGPHRRAAIHEVDYRRMGRGGKYHGDVAFLKQVFLKYYEQNWQP